MGFDIINYVKENIVVFNSVGAIANMILGAVFLRKTTSAQKAAEKIEELKSKKMEEVVGELLENGELSLSEMIKMKNYTEIARKADELRKNKQISTPLPTQNYEWHMRFCEACGNITDDDLRDIWVRILSGETEKPGSFSLRTIECLRNMSKEEAELFQKVCGYSYNMGNNIVLPKYDSILELSNISYSDVLRLEDCGVIKGDSFINIVIDVEDNPAIVSGNDLIAIGVRRKNNSSNRQLNVPNYLFTSCGRELFDIIDRQGDMNVLYNALQNSEREFDFVLGMAVSKTKEAITYGFPKR